LATVMAASLDPGCWGAARRERPHKAADGVPHSRRRRHGRITVAEAWNLHLAWVFAIFLGWPPNLFVTVNWTCAPSSTCPDSMRRLSMIRDRMKAFLRRHGVVALVWIEVRENPGDHAEHVHWAIFVPVHLLARFKAAMRHWIALDADSINRAAVVFRVIWDWVGLQRYLLKGGAAEVRRLFSVPSSMSPFQGPIDGPRVRVAHAIGATARRDSGWRVEALKSAAAHGA
jgi:hypothetical protein